MARTQQGKAACVLLALTLGASGIGGALPPGRTPARAGDATSPPIPPAVAPADATKSMEGTWVRIATDGRLADRVVKLVVRRLAPEAGEAVPGGAALLGCRWGGKDGPGREDRVRVDPTRSPGAIDFPMVVADQPGPPKYAPGIYRVEGDVLTVHFFAGGAARPTQLDKPERGGTLDVYLRIDP